MHNNPTNEGEEPSIEKEPIPDELLIQLLEMEMNRVNSLDSTLFTTRGWAITLISATTSLSLFNSNSTKTDYSGISFFIVALFITIVFFVIELLYRNVQLHHVQETRSLRKIIKSRYNCQGIIKIRGSSPLERYGYTILFYSIISLGLLILILILNC